MYGLIDGESESLWYKYAALIINLYRSIAGDSGETCEEAMLPHSRHGGFGFVIIWFPSMGEIQIMYDMYMDEAGIPMLITMPK